jgi:hypothetical protein
MAGSACPHIDIPPCLKGLRAKTAQDGGMIVVCCRAIRIAFNIPGHKAGRKAGQCQYEKRKKPCG